MSQMSYHANETYVYDLGSYTRCELTNYLSPLGHTNAFKYTYLHNDSSFL